MKVGYEANTVFQVHAATTCDSDGVIDVPLVYLRYKAVLLACYPLLNVSNKKTYIVCAHLTVHGNPSDLLVKISVKGKVIESQHTVQQDG